MLETITGQDDKLGAENGGTGPGPGWGPVRVGARSGLGPIWAHRALMGPILLKKLIILIKNDKNINKNIKVVKLEILKVKTCFGIKDLSSLDSIN